MEAMNPISLYNDYLTGFSLLLVAALLVPLFSAKRQWAGMLNFAFCFFASLFFVKAGFAAFYSGTPQPFTLTLFGVVVPFLIDGLSALFLILMSLMATIVAFYCIGYMEMSHYRHYSLRGFYFCYPLFVAGMVGIVTVDDLSFGFSIAWQMMTLASFWLIRFDHQDAKIVWSANKYLLLMEAAWLAILAAAFLLPHSTWGTPLHELTHALGTLDMPFRLLVFALLMLGFGMKAGMFPLGQLWLPDAHASAPSPISALLSGVMIKTGVYGLLRTLFWMMPESVVQEEGRYLGLVLAAFGVASLFIGTVQALKQDDAKRLHAYSSIGQMGYILLGLGVSHYFLLSGTLILQSLAVFALIGVLYHTVNHALFKALLFLCTGSVQYTTGTKDLNKLGGLINLMPLTALAAAIASVSIAGIPAVSGFMSKWAIVGSSLLGGKDAGIIVIFGIIALMTSAVTLACYVKFFGMTFTSIGAEWHLEKGAKPIREVPLTLLAPKLLLTILCLLQGFLPWVFVGFYTKLLSVSEGFMAKNFFAEGVANQILQSHVGGLSLNLSQMGGTSSAAVAMPVVLLGVFIIAYLLAALLRRSGGGVHRKTPVWLCGYQNLDSKNYYQSRHVFAAFKKFMHWTGANVTTATKETH